MHRPIKKAYAALVLIISLIVTSCTSDPLTSFNRFLIDNQSTINLIYITGSGLDERTIEIPQSNLIEIEVAEYDGDKAILISADEFFSQIEDDIYLLKEVNENLIEVLQLNTTGVLNWETEMVNDFTYNHILVVTDEILN